MWSQRAFCLGLAVLSIMGGVVADRTIVIPAQDESITYSTRGITPDVWRLVPPSSSSCDTPQMLTDRESDLMSFTFEGTGISVIGTVGPEQGLITFSLDGKDITTFDRGRPELKCDQVLFKLSNLPLEVHTVSGLLVGGGINPNTGEEDGVFSVQRIQYTLPDKWIPHDPRSTIKALDED